MKKAVIAVVSVIVLLATLIYLFPRDEGIKQKESIKLTKGLTVNVTKWYQNVVAGNFVKSVEYSNKIIGKIEENIPVPEYVSLCRENGINPVFLVTAFNQFDFQSWQHAIFFKQLSDKLVSEAPKVEPVKALFNAVHKRIKSVSAGKKYILWPRMIWKLRKGLCDRQAWVLCELAYQQGYETQIVYLMNSKTGVSPHTICEIRKGKKKWVADPFSGVLIEGKSVVDIMNDDALLEATWPGKKEWHAAIKSCIYFLPSYPQDYAVRNQELAKRVQLVLGKKAPRFGGNPAQRLFDYIHLTSKQERKRPFKLWFYPFRLLRSQMLVPTPKIKK